MNTIITTLANDSQGGSIAKLKILKVCVCMFSHRKETQQHLSIAKMITNPVIQADTCKWIVNKENFKFCLLAFALKLYLALHKIN